MKAVRFMIALSIVLLFFLGLIFFGDTYHPALQTKRKFIEEMETNALFYSESPEALEASFELKRGMEK